MVCDALFYARDFAHRTAVPTVPIIHLQITLWSKMQIHVFLRPFSPLHRDKGTWLVVSRQHVRPFPELNVSRGNTFFCCARSPMREALRIRLPQRNNFSGNTWCVCHSTEIQYLSEMFYEVLP